MLTDHTVRIVDRARRHDGQHSDTDASASPEGAVADIGAEIAASMRADLRATTDVGDLPRRLLWAAMYVHDLELRL